ncbi:hypothetical protein ACHAWX_004658 [Stephanocyclus meneghinianus]
MVINARILPLSGISVVPTPLRRCDPSSTWCYSAVLSPSSSLPPGTNFLATQVWPSSRTASFVLEQHLDTSWTVCELGCGPGLPSLTAAKLGAARVIATDVEDVALEMVRMAALEQEFCTEGVRDKNGERLVTQKFDLTLKEESLPLADLYILSDVFESSRVAEGAAWHVKSLLGSSDNQLDRRYKSKSNDSYSVVDRATSTSRVWVFAQSDRAQRDSFLKSIREIHGYQNLDWTTNHNPDKDARLWLFDLNEMGVQYN